MKHLKHIFITLLILVPSIASAQVKFEAKVSKSKVGVIEPFEVNYTIGIDSVVFTPPSFKEFVVMNEKTTVVDDIYNTEINEYKKTITYRIVPKREGKFTIEEAQFIFKKNLYKSNTLHVEVVKEDFYDSEILDSKFEKGVHLVAQSSKAKLDIKDSLTINYKLLVSHRLGVSGWELLKNPNFQEFNVKDINLGDLEITYETFEEKKYRCVIIKRVALQPKEKGEFKISGLAINIQAELPVKNNDKITMQKVTKTIKSNDLVINVN
jgi:hypothetical protein